MTTVVTTLFAISLLALFVAVFSLVKVGKARRDMRRTGEKLRARLAKCGDCGDRDRLIRGRCEECLLWFDIERALDRLEGRG